MMIEFIIEKGKKNWKVMLAGFLWLLVWSGYDANFWRVFDPGFPSSVMDFLQAVRSFVPIAVVALALIFLLATKRFFLKRFFLTPLGLLLVYVAVGCVSAVLSPNPWWALYWALMYGSVILALLVVSRRKNASQNLSFIIRVNWVIAGALAVGLCLFILAQPGIVSALTYNFLICKDRLYENIAGIAAAVSTFGVAGTRPTGLGRYAGIAALVMLAVVLAAKKSRKKIWWLYFSLFSLFLFILLFSKVKTEIVSFLIAAPCLLVLHRKINRRIIAASLAIVAMSLCIVLFNVPCNNNLTLFNTAKTFVLARYHALNPPPPSQIAQLPASPTAPKTPAPKSPKPSPVPQPSPSESPKPVPPPKPVVVPPPQNSEVTFKSNVLVLSGRLSTWESAWNLFLRSPIIGFGFQADRYFLNNQHAHNSILHALVQTGLLGTLPFMLAFIISMLWLYRLLMSSSVPESQKVFLIEIAGVLIFLVIRGALESLAFYSADWLFVAPLIAYIQFVYEQYQQIEGKGSVMHVAGNTVHMVSMEEVVLRMSAWIEKKERAKWVVATGMHGVMEAHKNAEFKKMLATADLWVADGISLVWLARLKGFDAKKRVTGPDLFHAFLQHATQKGYKSYFYGDTDETLAALATKLQKELPGSKFESFSPPFRKLTPEEDAKIIADINAAKPDVLWVGLGMPKQETWIFQHRAQLQVPVIVGVGAAFKFEAGAVTRASLWMQNAGLEWLHRLFQEPKRVWRRVFIDMPQFMWLVLIDFIKG